MQCCLQALAVVPGKESQGRENIDLICRSYQETIGGDGEEEGRRSRKVRQTGEQDSLSSLSSPYKASWSQQFRALLWRSWLTVLREPLIMKVRITQAVVSRTKAHSVL